MLVNLSNIFTRGETEKQLDTDFDFSAENVSYDAAFEQPVKASLHLKKGSGETFIKLTVQATAKCSCARCLKLFEKDFSFSQEFIVTPATLTDPESEIPVNNSNILDVKQLVLQELSLEIPAVLLCKEDCQGLCPKCGKPRSEGPCGCPEKEIDPRLAILKTFFDDEEK